MPDNARSPRRSGRGRLSSIDLLPQACDADVAQANADLHERRLPQTEILQRLNAALAAKGIKSISKGAFHRYSTRIAIDARRIKDAASVLAAAIAEPK
jgi:hypothetical protein